MTDKALLEAALIGYEAQAEKIEAAIRDIRGRLGNTTTRGSRPFAVAEKAPRKKRTMSPAARKRIAAAQKKRWADWHAAQKG
jgi:hypothetical protein